jgi:nucleotide-binding universal stress UspA family protein
MHRRVMVAIDPRTTPGPAVEEAAVLARAHAAELVIGVAYADRKTSEERRIYAEAPARHQWRLSPGVLAEHAANAAVERAREHAGDSVVIRAHCEPGKTVQVLMQMVEDLEVDVLVLDVRPGHGAYALTPRAAKALARKAQCEVAGAGVGAALPVAPQAGTVADSGALRLS